MLRTDKPFLENTVRSLTKAEILMEDHFED